MRKMLIFLLFILFSSKLFAGEIEFIGRAAIIKDDVRIAQKNSLNNALVGGLKRYLQINLPERRADPTSDYFIFIESYEIIERKLDNNVIFTKVKININDTILEDVATFVTNQVNTAVFLISGVPSYVDERQLRNLVSAIFNEKQFSTKDQIAFEQELIDRNDRMDVQNAFQSISSQYLFQIKFSVLNYKSGESCTVQSDASYISSSNLAAIVPIMRAKITIEADDPSECILLSVSTLLENTLSHVRDKQIASPGKPIELLEHTLVFEDLHDMKSVNSIVDGLLLKRFIKTYDLEEFYGTTAMYNLESYFSTEQLAQKIVGFNLTEGTTIEYGGNTITIRLVE